MHRRQYTGPYEPRPGRLPRSMQPALPALATVMDLLPDAVCIVDPEGRYLYVSAGFERIFGYRSDEILGRRMIELVHPDDRERTQAAAARA